MSTIGQLKNNVEILTKSETITLIQDGTYLSFELAFTNVNSVTVNHNLNKYPVAILKDSTGRQSFVSIQHIDKNNLTASWQGNTTGAIICS